MPTLDAMIGAQDIVLLPDPATFRVLPWLDGVGWLLCDLHTTAGEPVPLSTRGLCRQAADALAGAGYQLRAGLEIELHLYDLASGPAHPPRLGAAGREPRRPGARPAGAAAGSASPAWACRPVRSRSSWDPDRWS